jgi:uncharacterized membrane protein
MGTDGWQKPYSLALNRNPCLISEGNKGEETDLYIVNLARFKVESTMCVLLVHFFLISLRWSLIDSTIRAVTVVFISIAKCLKSSSSSVGIFIVVLVSCSSLVSFDSM